MKVYKFRDKVDKNHAYVLADTLLDAQKALCAQTSMPFEFEKASSIIINPIIIKNNIAPF